MLTDHEQRQLLKVTGERRDGYRDHVLYSTALATGLREHELAGLEIGDVFEANGVARSHQSKARWRACPASTGSAWTPSGPCRR
jgi:integrase/recombinase XerC